MSDRTYTVADLCELYGVGEHTVLGWIRGGELRALNVGRTPHGGKPRWRVTAAALIEFEATRASAPAHTPASLRRAKGATNGVIKFY